MRIVQIDLTYRVASELFGVANSGQRSSAADLGNPKRGPKVKYPFIARRAHLSFADTCDTGVAIKTNKTSPQSPPRRRQRPRRSPATQARVHRDIHEDGTAGVRHDVVALADGPVTSSIRTRRPTPRQAHRAGAELHRGVRRGERNRWHPGSAALQGSTSHS